MISVCMTTYNGEKYLKEQIDSILPQLTNDDELLISDDGLADNTVKIIKEYQQVNSNIYLFDGPRKGVLDNFSFVFSKAKGEYVFICDQDDIWCQDKILTMKDAISKYPNKFVVMHDAYKIENKYYSL